MALMGISLLGMLGCVIVAWRVDKAFAVKLAILVLVILVIAGVAMGAGGEEPVRNWMVPVV